MNRIQAGADAQFRTNIELIKLQAKAADELAEKMGDTPEAKAARDRSTRDRLLEEDRRFLEEKKRANDELLDSQLAAEKELIAAQTRKADLGHELKDINEEITKLEEKQKASGLRPDEHRRLSGLRRIQSWGEIQAAEADQGVTTASAAVSTARGAVGASDREIATLRASIASRSAANAFGDNASGRAAAVGSAVNTFFEGGGVLTGGRTTPVNMMAEFKSAISELAQSRMQQQQLMMILTNIFRDGVVTKSELIALQQAVQNQRRP